LENTTVDNCALENTTVLIPVAFMCRNSTIFVSDVSALT
jgi:hypothetical protein